MNRFEFVSIHYPFYEKKAIKVVADYNTIPSYQAYIRENRIEMADIIMPNLVVLRGCPSLKYLKIAPSSDSLPNFDFSPLYDMPQVLSLNCQNQYGDRGQHIGIIDYSKINGLIELSVGVNKGTLNFNQIKTLRSLRVGGFTGENHDISDLFCSAELDTLRLIDCNIHSLNGIEKAPRMQCIYLSRNRRLSNIDALSRVKTSLKALRVENCSQIKDFSVLEQLEQLELLELSGSNEIPSLDFLSKMKNLKTFVFNVNVKDGDLSPCLLLRYVYSEKNRKHYNLKDKDLPKGQYVRGNETIEPWRRLE